MGQLGDDGDGDLDRRFAADIQPHRRVQAGDPLLGNIELSQPRQPLLSGALRTQGTHVPGFGAKRLHQGHIVDPRIVGQGYDYRVPVRCKFPDDIIRHALYQSNSRPLPLRQHLRSRVSHDYLIVHGDTQLCQVVGQLTCAHQQHTCTRAKALPQALLVPLERGEMRDRRQAGCA